MTDQKRPYRKQRRAELEDATRRRITDSAVELHGSLGPSRTSLSAVARHAGVRRSTLYRHFPDEAALFAACTAHWLATNPVPDLARWAAIADPHERLLHALADVYRYYARNERMLANVLRDEASMPIVATMFAGFREYLEAARATLMADWPARGSARRRAFATIGHALTFSTWQSLVREQGLDPRAAAALLCELAAGYSR